VPSTGREECESAALIRSVDERAHQEHGPERAAEVEILRGLNRLSDRVIGDVFESFSKHPPGSKLRSK